ncbi:YveK family protein [Actinomycetes bacterium M1A6_2h]
MTDGGLSEYVAAVTRYPRWFALGLLVAFALATALLIISGRGYESRATVLVWTSSTSDIGSATAGNQYALSRVTTYAELARTPEIARAVAETVGASPTELESAISATATPNTPLLALAVRANSGSTANDLMASLIRELSSRVESLEQVAGQLDPRAQLVVVDEPHVLPRTSYTHGGLIGAGAFIAGIALGGLLAVLRSLFDDRIRRPEDAADAADAPVLGIADVKDAAATAPVAALISGLVGSFATGPLLLTTTDQAQDDHLTLADAVTSVVLTQGRSTDDVMSFPGAFEHSAAVEAATRASFVLLVCDARSTTLRGLECTARVVREVSSARIGVVLTHARDQFGSRVVVLPSKQETFA